MDEFKEHDSRRKRNWLKIDYVDWQPYSNGCIFPLDKAKRIEKESDNGKGKERDS
jgi:hypothetical protein